MSAESAIEKNFNIFQLWLTLATFQLRVHQFYYAKISQTRKPPQLSSAPASVKGRVKEVILDFWEDTRYKSPLSLRR